MTGDEMGEMARQCLRMMQSMSAMMGMHADRGTAGGMPGMGGIAMGGMGTMMDMAGGLGLVSLFLAVGAALVVAVLVTRRSTSFEPTDRSPARVELDRRYVRGDVDRETYLQIRRDLLQPPRG